jgi:hypothetical protein
VPGIIARIIAVCATINRSTVETRNKPLQRSTSLSCDAVIDKSNQGFVQVLPLVLLAIFASSIFVVVGQVAREQQDVRSRAVDETCIACRNAQNGPYPRDCSKVCASPGTPTPTPKPASTNTPTVAVTTSTQPTTIPKVVSQACLRDASGNLSQMRECYTSIGLAIPTNLLSTQPPSSCYQNCLTRGVGAQQCSQECGGGIQTTATRTLTPTRTTTPAGGFGGLIGGAGGGSGTPAVANAPVAGVPPAGVGVGVGVNAPLQWTINAVNSALSFFGQTPIPTATPTVLPTGTVPIINPTGSIVIIPTRTPTPRTFAQCVYPNFSFECVLSVAGVPLPTIPSLSLNPTTTLPPSVQDPMGCRPACGDGLHCERDPNAVIGRCVRTLPTITLGPQQPVVPTVTLAAPAQTITPTGALASAQQAAYDACLYAASRVGDAGIAQCERMFSSASTPTPVITQAADPCAAIRNELEQEQCYLRRGSGLAVPSGVPTLFPTIVFPSATPQPVPTATPAIPNLAGGTLKCGGIDAAALVIGQDHHIFGCDGATGRFVDLTALNIGVSVADLTEKYIPSWFDGSKTQNASIIAPFQVALAQAQQELLEKTGPLVSCGNQIEGTVLAGSSVGVGQGYVVCGKGANGQPVWTSCAGQIYCVPDWANIPSSVKKQVSVCSDASLEAGTCIQDGGKYYTITDASLAQLYAKKHVAERAVDQAYASCMLESGATSDKCQSDALTGLGNLPPAQKAQYALSFQSQSAVTNYYEQKELFERCKAQYGTQAEVQCGGYKFTMNKAFFETGGVYGFTTEGADSYFATYIQDKYYREYVEAYIAWEECEASERPVSCPNPNQVFADLKGIDSLCGAGAKTCSAQIKSTFDKALADFVAQQIADAAAGGDPLSIANTQYSGDTISSVDLAKLAIFVPQDGRPAKKVLPGELACDARTGGCVVNVFDGNSSKLQNVDSVTSAHAFRCPAECRVIGDSTTVIANGGGAKCIDDGTLEVRKGTRFGVSVSQVSCASGVCSSGACVEGKEIIDPISGTYKMCLVGQTCTAYDPVVGTTVNVRPVASQIGESGLFKKPQDVFLLETVFANETQRDAFLSAYDQNVTAFMKDEGYSDAYIKDFVAYRNTPGTSGALLENFKTHQMVIAKDIVGTLANLDYVSDPNDYLLRVASGQVSAIAAHQALENLKENNWFTGAVIGLNDFTRGSLKEGNGLQLQAVAKYEELHDIKPITIPIVNYEISSTFVANALMTGKALSNLNPIVYLTNRVTDSEEERQIQAEFTRGSLIASAQIAAAAVGLAALPVAGILAIPAVGVLTAPLLATIGVGAGVIGTTASLQRTAMECVPGQPVTTECRWAAANTAFQAASTAFGVVAGTQNAIAQAASQARTAAKNSIDVAKGLDLVTDANQLANAEAIANATSMALTGGRAIQYGNIALGAGGAVIAGREAVMACSVGYPDGQGGRETDSTMCATNLLQIAGSVLRIAQSVSFLRSVPTSQQAAQLTGAAADAADATGGSLQAAATCIVGAANFDLTNCAMSVSQVGMAAGGFRNNFVKPDATTTFVGSPDGATIRLEEARAQLAGLYDTTGRPTVSADQIAAAEANVRNLITVRGQEMALVNAAMTEVAGDVPSLSALQSAQQRYRDALKAYAQAPDDAARFVAAKTLQQASNDVLSYRSAVEVERGLIEIPRNIVQRGMDGVASLLGLGSVRQTYDAYAAARSVFETVVQDSPLGTARYDAALFALQKAHSDVQAIGFNRSQQEIFADITLRQNDVRELIVERGRIMDEVRLAQDQAAAQKVVADIQDNLTSLQAMRVAMGDGSTLPVWDSATGQWKVGGVAVEFLDLPGFRLVDEGGIKVWKTVDQRGSAGANAVLTDVIQAQTAAMAARRIQLDNQVIPDTQRALTRANEVLRIANDLASTDAQVRNRADIDLQVRRARVTQLGGAIETMQGEIAQRRSDMTRAGGVLANIRQTLQNIDRVGIVATLRRTDGDLVIRGGARQDLLQKQMSFAETRTAQAVGAEIISNKLFADVAGKLQAARTNATDIAGTQRIIAETYENLSRLVNGQTEIYRLAEADARTRLEAAGLTDQFALSESAARVAKTVETQLVNAKTQIEFFYLKTGFEAVSKQITSVELLQAQFNRLTPSQQRRSPLRAQIATLDAQINKNFTSVLAPDALVGKTARQAMVELATQTSQSLRALPAELGGQLAGAFDDIAQIRERIVDDTLAGKPRAEIEVQLRAFSEKLTQVNDMVAQVAGRSNADQKAVYEQLGVFQSAVKQLTLLGELSITQSRLDQATTVRDTQTVSQLSRRMQDLALARQIKLPDGLDPVVQAKFSGIVADTELRLAVLDGDFRTLRGKQADTILGLLGSNYSAVELQTAGGKTVVLTGMLRTDVEIFGRNKGLYVARNGQADEFLGQIRKLVPNGQEAVVWLKSDDLRGDIATIRRVAAELQAGKILLTEPEDLAFIRNMATEAGGDNPEKSRLIRDIYTRITQDVALGVDELQLAFDPSVQMINPPAASRATVPPELVGAARLVHAALLNLDIMAAKNPEQWRTSPFGQAITKGISSADGSSFIRDPRFTPEAQEAIFRELARDIQVPEATFRDIVTRAQDIEGMINNPTALAAEAQRLNMTSDKIIQVLDLVDTTNRFASGLTLAFDSAFFRGVDINGRVSTIPGTQGSESTGQTFSSRMQAVMEAIGATAHGDTANFDNLTVAPDIAYRSGFHDVIRDVLGYSNGAVRAVTGNIAEQFGVLENSYQMGASKDDTGTIAKIFDGQEGNPARLVYNRSYQTPRGSWLDTVANIKNQGLLDRSGIVGTGHLSNGNAKITMAGDLNMSPLEFARQQVLRGAFDADTTWLVQVGGADYVEVKFLPSGDLAPGYGDAQGNVLASRKIVDPTGNSGAIARRYRDPSTKNLVTVIGRGGATGDNIPTPENVPGITITTKDTPQGVVLQGASRLDRNEWIATQYLVVIDDAVTTSKSMDRAQFAEFRASIAEAQRVLELQNTAQANTLGLESAYARPLADIIMRFGSIDSPQAQRVADWASQKLLEQSTRSQSRDLRLSASQQRTIEARNRQFVELVRQAQALMTDPGNASFIEAIRVTSPDLYNRLLASSNAAEGVTDLSQALTYASEGAVVTTKDAPLLAGDLAEYRRAHKRQKKHNLPVEKVNLISSRLWRV